MKRIFHFLKTPPAEKKLFGKALILVIIIRLVLWSFPFKWFKRRLSKILAADARTERIDWTEINRIVRQTRKAAGFVPQASCLTQALAALLLIKLDGQHSELKIGVARGENQKFQAHAWLEINGRIIIGKLPKHSKFKVLESIAG